MNMPILEMHDISKSFPGVQALNKVNFSISQGEVVGLLGENGAGKSTLVKVLTGVYQPDGGTILWEGKNVHFPSIREAQVRGISIIFQELNNCPNLNALENLFLGRELFKKGTAILDFSQMKKKALEIFEYLDLSVDINVQVGTLSTAIQQMLEIAKALLTNVRLLVMDEPTSSLTEKETSKLFSVIRELKSKGIAVIFISHKLEEVFKISDRMEVLRDGENAGTLDPAVNTVDELIALMVGRELGTLYTHRRASVFGEEIFRVEGISGPPYIHDVSFNLHKGEIIGMAGLIGAGRTETAKLIIGAEKYTRGKIFISGKEVRISSPADAVRKGLAYLPEDRKVLSLILGMTVRENITMAIHRLITGFLNVIDRRKERKIVDSYIDSLNIKVSHRDQIVGNLSGGNQQKVVISKWLAAEPKIFILDEPTRGIDVHAKSEVHKIISGLADAGVSIILISSELPEILALSDRVLVMHEGRVKGMLEREGLTQEGIMSAVFGSDDMHHTAKNNA